MKELANLSKSSARKDKTSVKIDRSAVRKAERAKRRGPGRFIEAAPLAQDSYNQPYQVEVPLDLAAYLGFEDIRDLWLWITSPIYLTAFAEFIKLGCPPLKFFAEAAHYADHMFRNDYDGELPDSFEEAEKLWGFEFSNGKKVNQGNDDRDCYICRIAYMLEYLVAEDGWVDVDKPHQKWADKTDDEKRHDAALARSAFEKQTGLRAPENDAAHIKISPQWEFVCQPPEVDAEAWNRAHNSLRHLHRQISEIVIPGLDGKDAEAKFKAQWEYLWFGEENGVLSKQGPVSRGHCPSWMHKHLDKYNLDKQKYTARIDVAELSPRDLRLVWDRADNIPYGRYANPNYISLLEDMEVASGSSFKETQPCFHDPRKAPHISTHRGLERLHSRLAWPAAKPYQAPQVDDPGCRQSRP